MNKSERGSIYRIYARIDLDALEHNIEGIKRCKSDDAMLMGVECPHEYLEEEYGDYMQLPPEEKRKQHGFHYLDLNTPYRDYLANKNGK